ncbi:MAG: hypothetical protein NTY20_04240 [Candidatus Aenigmarchaeota archaeon]|nr:hypothetical protein [Candidatus Aenigmarchaeota archaeon]
MILWDEDIPGRSSPLTPEEILILDEEKESVEEEDFETIVSKIKS